MAKSPKKATDVTMVATTLSDSEIIMGKFTRTQLENLLNDVNNTTFAIYMQGEGTDAGSNNQLVMAAMSEGQPSATAQEASSDELPCPPYCKK